MTLDGLNVDGDRINDHRVFGKEFSGECCSSLYISMCPKLIYCCEKYCAQI